ncbi:MAG: DEAD/DEAH box helicase family protein, partial [Leptospiraceae bacterium]|nr:DEAD/DEAH box helicase family protein [Leptospiraceae bacterium]
MNQLRFSGIRDNKKRGSVSDFLKEFIQPKSKLSFVSAFFTIYAYHKMKENLDEIDELRFLFGEPRFIRSLDPEKTDKKAFNIEDNVLSLSNRLEQSRIARECESWIREKVQIRSIRKPNFLHGKMYHIRERGGLTHCITGSSNFTVNGLGLNEIPNIELNLITNDNRDIQDLLNWFNEIWESEHVEDVKGEVIEYLKQLYLDYSPEFIYYKTLYHIFQKYLQDKANLDLLENKTHFFDTLIWNKLFEFQKDGVKSAINKIEEYNGCIIADSVGLGKTFEALAVIKYFELRNDRVLVLCPKKLRNNWTVYQATNQTSLNPFIDDKFGYMVLNHTDLRDEGRQGDVDLSSVLWGNFDLVVIDESHNFRNNTKGKRDEEGNTIRKSRYEKLMQDIIQSGKNTKVLLLTATPVNVNLGDLKNQLYFLSAGDDYKYSESIGIDSIHRTLTNSQKIFTLWADPKNTNRKTEDLIEKLPPGFFKLLDELTIARSRKHIIKYYKANLEKIGSFPKRKKPIKIKKKIDLNDRFMSYDKIYKEISEYRLSLFTPFTFLKTEMIPEYEKKVSPRMVKNFTQEKREYFLAGMMKVNFMKRLESSIHSFRITIDRTIRK